MQTRPTDSYGAALAIAISALAGIGLFWAIVFCLVLLNQGPALVDAGATAAGSTSGIKITELASLFTAFCALVVAFGGLALTRHHNRLSVRPKISIVRVVENKDKMKRGFYLRNHGLGPAMFVELSFELKNSGATFQDSEAFAMFLLSEYGFRLGDLGLYWLEMLPKDGCERVLWLESDDLRAVELFNSLMFELRFAVHYKSFYGEKATEVYEFEPTGKKSGY